MQCPACAAEISGTGRFCSECGSALVRGCSSCGFENTPAARFCGGCGTALLEPEKGSKQHLSLVANVGSTAAASVETTVAPGKARHLAPHPERRQLTVMFCDLVGSTELSTTVDPEVLSDLYSAYREIAEEVVATFEGHIAEYLGDGIVAYFGYPSALENAAELSVRAGHAIIDRIGTMKHDLDVDGLAVRIGIATGLVVAGQLLGSSSMSQVRTVVGETPNLAARLQAAARPNSVVISDSTRVLIPNQFQLRALKPLVLKGFAGEVTPYVVEQLESTDSADIDLLHDGLLVGREQELSLLTDRWRSTREGEGQTLLLSGEPGIGKSRLVRAFRSELATEKHTWLELRSSPLFRNTAFRPVIDLLKTTFGFNDQQDIEQALEGSGWDSSESLPILCDLLSLPYSGEDLTSELTLEGRRRRTLELLCGWVFRLSEDNATTVVAEDLHWIDPSTLELLSLLVEQCPTRSVLIICTFRLDFQPGWHHLTHVSTLPLRPLRQKEINDLVTQVLDGAQLPLGIAKQISDRTDGVPLFVEELVKSVLESGALQKEGDRFERTDLLPALEIPTTLQDSLMARLDRLGTAKDVVQLASVVGREFSFQVINALFDMSEERLVQELEQLVEAQVVYQRGVPPRADYVFKHAMIQETAYQSLLRKNRQAYHKRVAEVLVNRFPEKASEEPEVLALHFARGGEELEAFTYYQLAGDRAGERYALEEQINHYDKGIEVLLRLPDSQDRDQRELSLRMAVQGPLIAARGYAKPEVRDTCERARVLCEEVGNIPDLGIAIYGLTTYYLNSCKVEDCLEACEQLLDFSRLAGNEAYRPFALQQRSFINYFKGDLQQARADCQQSIERYDVEQHRELGELLGQHTGPTAHFLNGAVTWHLGSPDQALAHCHQGMEMARENGGLIDLFTLAMTQQFTIWVHIYRRDRKATLEMTENAIELAERHGFIQLIHQSHCLHAWARSSEEPAEALEEYQASVEELNKVGATIANTFFASLYAEILAANKQHEVALAMLEKTLSFARNRGNHYMDAWVLRTRAELLLSMEAPDIAGARHTLRESAENARRIGSPSLELRPLNLLISLGEADNAERARHAELFQSFEEGHDTLDLMEARALLG